MNPENASGPRSKGFLRAHLLIILFAMVLSVLAAVPVFALRPTKYVASSSVIVKPEVFNGVPTAASMGTEAAIATSGNVLTAAAQLLREPEQVVRQNVSVGSAVDTTVLTITFRGTTPSSAYNGASTVTRAYVDYRNRGSDARAAQVITNPTMPTAPIGVNYTLVITVALVGGFLVGIAASVLWDLAMGARAGGRRLSARGRGEELEGGVTALPWPAPSLRRNRQFAARQREASGSETTS